MARIRDIAAVCKSKNAGPFELTIDVVFDNPEMFAKVKRTGMLGPALFARLYGLRTEDVLFTIYNAALAFKATLPRLVPASDIGDTDVYGTTARAAARSGGPALTPTLLPTTVVGSYPQPDWLIDRDKLTHLPPVRVRAQELWRVPELWLDQAQDDATVLAIRDMERAGIDIITDGEIRRESYSNRFATALSGVDLDNPATVAGRSGGSITVPRIVGPIRRLHPVEVRDVEFLRRNTDSVIKITLPGPFTMSCQAKNEYYEDEEELVMEYAAAVNAELRDLKAAGADVIQLDEPWVQARPEEARRLALPAIDRALDGIPGPRAVHLCFGYAYVARNKPSGYSFLPELTATVAEQISIEAAQPNLDLTTLDGLDGKTVIFGVISMGDPEPESPETVAARIRRALEHIPPDRLIPAPDCGMKYIPRETAFAKLKALAEGAAIVRRELTGS